MIAKKFDGVFEIGGKLATKNLVPGARVYGEKLVRVGKEEYRLWDPFRSKLSAAILKGLRELPIGPGSHVLYLGAATGTTASHVSDMVGKRGVVFCVEFAQRSMRELLRVCERRENMLPLFHDARKPEEYERDVRRVDVIYQDVADPEQAEILLRNARMLRKGGHAMLAIKSQSINIAEPPSWAYEKVLKELAREFEVIQKIDLAPFHKGHLFALLRKR